MVTSELPAVEPEDGRVATPIVEANAVRVLVEPDIPEVALPPSSYEKLLAPLIVTTAPLDKVNWTASAANFEEEIDRPSTNCILFAPLVSTIVTVALAAIELEMLNKGTAKVRVQYIEEAPLDGNQGNYFNNSKPGFLRKIWRATSSALTDL